MGALKIECYLNEKQMLNVVKFISDHLANVQIGELEDISEEIDGVRVSVSFGGFLETITIEDSVILDKDWDLLYEDTAVLTSRLRTEIDSINNDRKIAYREALGIREHEISY